ncbi:PQQ-dependent sugar dehydrogenase [Sporosarcina sp. Marseille-Q4063]|uniref:PQQ-dependent sugar dehydrogenase n=1 Tax=Sporosarcina sp. Marseille-Q4063 TaxID=2810514 RepID=UPI001BAFF288|nr:PQQ-dependent sugar dehydrogenase [Sporosarcina sp. Marseille-Q4063]QUW20827.1 PQQ-dependent sugar dehydrogenase [Sporosarcina sp. Marseille-Q4063]
MRKYVLLLLLIIMGGCSESVTTQDVESTVFPEKVATNLEVPWSIAKNGDTFFISERGGTIVKITPDGNQIRENVKLDEPLSTASEAGLLGFVLKEDFVQSSEAYAYYVYDVNGSPVNRIISLQYDGSSWSEKEILLDGVSSGSVHHGGRLAISPDGILFATIGDGANPEAAQDLDSLNGKILRYGEDSKFHIYTYGHRNPQGLAWDPQGAMYASEHGQSANDEINIIIEGNNYGWPIIEGVETAEGMETPILTSGSDDTWAPSGMAFHKNLLYVTSLRGQEILVIDPESHQIIDTIKGFGRVRDVFSDGKSLYFISNNTDGRGNPSNDDDVLYQLIIK